MVETIGIIGLGGMGQMYAKIFADKGYRVLGSDLPENKENIEKNLAETGTIIKNNNNLVAREADLLIYSVPAEYLEETIANTASSIKKGAIVGGQTSVKTLEIEAFKKYLQKDNHIISPHSMHNPTVDPKGQTCIIIDEKSSSEAYDKAIEVYEKLGSRLVNMDYKEHDHFTAETQTVTHTAYISIATAWKNAGQFPWQNNSYSGGIDNIKALMALRIHANKPHTYSSIAMFNPYSEELVTGYDHSVKEIFSMMISGNRKELEERIKKAGDKIFNGKDKELLLEDSLMGEFSLADQVEGISNSHLSLLAMVDSWARTGKNPYKHLEINETPPFKLRLGIAEYLFKNEKMLSGSLDAAIDNLVIREDDLQYLLAVREWSRVLKNKDIKGYDGMFKENQEYFKGQIPAAEKKSKELISRLT